MGMPRHCSSRKVQMSMHSSHLLCRKRLTARKKGFKVLPATVKRANFMSIWGLDRDPGSMPPWLGDHSSHEILR